MTEETTCSVCGKPAAVMLTSESDDEPICEGCYRDAARGLIGDGCWQGLTGGAR